MCGPCARRFAQDPPWSRSVPAPVISRSSRAGPAQRGSMRSSRIQSSRSRNSWREQRVRADRLMTAPMQWQTIDYWTVESPDAEGTVEMAAARDGDARGICAWFDTELYGGEGFSNAPGAPEAAVYGQVYFPI